MAAPAYQNKRAPIAQEDAAAIKAPTLLTGGENTPTSFPQILDALEGLLPGTRRVTTGSASHMMNVDGPERLNAA